MNVKTHERIVRDALIGRMSAEALNWVVVANLRCDLYQLSPERHFDSAPDRETLGRLWRMGLRRFYLRALDLMKPPAFDASQRKPALQYFGRASHALADFYAHTNWVEIQVAAGDMDALAPLLETPFDPQNYPEELQSGYYSLRYGIKGCPNVQGSYLPPAPFRFCHETIAKDHADKGHGADLATPAGPSYYELAVNMAVRSTAELWERFCEQVEEQAGSLSTVEVLAWGVSSL